MKFLVTGRDLVGRALPAESELWGHQVGGKRTLAALVTVLVVATACTHSPKPPPSVQSPFQDVQVPGTVMNISGATDQFLGIGVLVEFPDQPLSSFIINDVALIDASPGLALGEAYVQEREGLCIGTTRRIPAPGGDCGVAKLPGWKATQAVLGQDSMGLLLGLRATTGGYHQYTGVVLAYTSGGEEQRVVIPQAGIVCTPRRYEAGPCARNSPSTRSALRVLLKVSKALAANPVVGEERLTWLGQPASV